MIWLAKTIPTKKHAGAVLLEVLLALVLFVAAAAVVTASLNASLDGLDRVKLNLHAHNLATSVLAELQLGIRPAEMGTARPFEKPFQDWSWELVLAPIESELSGPSGLTQVEVIIRRKSPELVHRQAEWIKLEARKPASSRAAISGVDPLFLGRNP